MTNLFKKAAVFTDLHLGAKSNSDLHNEDCFKFVEWFVKEAKKENCETCFFLGDYHNNRATMNLRTMSWALRCLELLSKSFEQTFFIVGNHDLYYRDRRDIQSVEWAKHIPNIQIVNDFFTAGDVSIVPWLVADDYKKIPKINAKYMFGHFEIPNFYMNSVVKMPEHGELKQDQFNGFDTVFSGHFHKRQQNKNITYIGNAFPHNYSDAGDDERGMMILDWGKDPEFKSWPDQPKFRVYNLSDVLHETEKLLLPNMHCRVNIDIDISYEEATFIRETFLSTYNLRELALLPIKNNDLEQNILLGNVAFESVDSIVTSQITAIDSEAYDAKLLLDIYQNL